MTKREMNQIFSILSIAYPGKKPFCGEPDELKPAIELWCVCLPDVDFWTGKQAAIRICRECTFPPTIAEFRKKANDVKSEVEEEIDRAWYLVEMPMRFNGMSPADAYARLSDGMEKAAIDAMGGPDKLIVTADGKEFYNVSGFRMAYEALTRERSASPVSARRAIGAKAR